MLLPFLLLILGIAFFNIFVISARLNARAWLFYSSFVVAKLRVLKDFVFYDLSFSFWRTKKYNGILLNGWSIKMWKIAKSTFCDKKTFKHTKTIWHTLFLENVCLWLDTLNLRGRLPIVIQYQFLWSMKIIGYMQ